MSVTAIYAIGGVSDEISSTVERYDLAADRFARVAPLRRRRDCAAAAAVGGELVVCGGRDKEYAEETACERLAASGDAWVDEHAAYLQHHRREHGAVAAGGRVYAIGGWRAAQRLASVEVYDPATRRWSAGVDLPVPMAPVAAFAVDGADAILAIGATTTPERRDVWIFDLVDRRWERAGELAARRWSVIAAHGDALYVFGGEHGGGPTAAVERYDVASGALERVSEMPTARHSMAAVTVGGAIHVIGGDRAGYTRSAAHERFDVARATWQRLAPLGEPRVGLCAAAM